MAALKTETPITAYDKRELYDEKIRPLINEICSLCSNLGIPAFMTFAVENSSEGTVYERKIIHAVAREELRDDVLASLLLKMNGFQQTYPDDIQDAIRTISQYLDRQQYDHLDITEPKKSEVLQEDEIIEFSNFVGGSFGISADSKEGSTDNFIFQYEQ